AMSTKTSTSTAATPATIVAATGSTITASSARKIVYRAAAVPVATATDAALRIIWSGRLPERMSLARRAAAAMLATAPGGISTMPAITATSDADSSVLL